jgi:hypothetical protein
MPIFNLPPPPVSQPLDSAAWQNWFYRLRNALVIAGSIAWSSITDTPTTLAGYGITSPLPIAEGGTATIDVPANGELLIGNGVDYDVATLTAGTNITITNGAGTITIDSSGGGGGAVSNVLSGDLTIEADTSYIVMGYLDVGDFNLIVEGNLGIL